MIGRRALIAGALASPLAAAMAQAAPGRASSTEYFVLIHAQGGWDVTLFADPRFEAVGAMMPATTANQDVRGLRLWADGPAAGVDKSFRPVIPKGRDVAFGPGIGDLLDIFDRVTILNGVAMSTVAHPDGAAFAISGRHLVGGRPVASSLDAVLADAFGPTQMLPVVSVAFPSSFVGQRLGPHAIPIETANIDGLGAALTRSDHTTNADDRADVARLLEAEATRTARLSTYPQRSVAMSAQFGALARLSREGVGGLFGNAALRKAYPSLPWTGRAGPATQSAAFALEAVRRDIARVVAFSMGGFDTHASNYRQHGAALQDLFQLVTAMVRVFDAGTCRPRGVRRGRPRGRGDTTRSVHLGAQVVGDLHRVDSGERPLLDSGVHLSRAVVRVHTGRAHGRPDRAPDLGRRLRGRPHPVLEPPRVPVLAGDAVRRPSGDVHSLRVGSGDSTRDAARVGGAVHQRW